MIAGTNQGFLLCYDLDGALRWSRLFDRGIRHLARLGDDTLVAAASGEVGRVGLSGDVRTECRMPGPCSIVEAGDTGVYLACEQAVWRI